MAWKHGKHFWTHVRLPDGTRKRRSLGTDNKGLAREIESMLAMLHGRRDWELIEAAVFGPISVGELYDYWSDGEDGLHALRAKLSDVDLNTYVDGWKQWAQRRAIAATVEKYTKQLRGLIPKSAPFPRSQFTQGT